MTTASPQPFVRIPSLKTVADFRAHAARLGVQLDCDDVIQAGPQSPLAQPLKTGGRTIGNRWAVQPMEGWDGATDGRPTEHIMRRWRRFGESGAKLIWGGEAMAVSEDGRANPNQLIIDEDRKAGLAGLREELVRAHHERHGRIDDLLIGFQLTHSGRFCRPHDKKRLEPRVAYRHPILDRKFGVTNDSAVLTDEDVERLILRFIEAAKVAADVGADFVDIKHCHGYLLHEFLGAFARPGKFGGSFENRTRLVREIVRGIRAARPKLLIGVRLSAFDFVPYKPDPALSRPGKPGPGIPEDYSHCLPYRCAFGVNALNPVAYDLSETVRFLNLLKSLDVRLVNLSAGSPYYNPHIQRPAMYPPSDGYQPPEDPLVGVARQIRVVAQVKKQFPDMILVGSAYSYLQEYLPHVAQYNVRQGLADAVGLGRMILSYPELPTDVLRKGALAPRFICRTFSDCTTAPRNGLLSGCFPLDDYYKGRPEAQTLKQIKRDASA
ncbi:MAG: NADH:flavin oxidoreductase [Verrucomicrobia bacterium]|nr:NADH:flavin oxidoreductase [Verrucomicrobiota bacterium]